jgi:hypothetical protein
MGLMPAVFGLIIMLTAPVVAEGNLNQFGVTSERAIAIGTRVCFVFGLIMFVFGAACVGYALATGAGGL